MRSYFEPPPLLSNTPPPGLPLHQILADYYAERPGEVAKLSVLCVQLYSNAHFPSIFALLFHIWLLELGPDHRNAVSLFTVCVWWMFSGHTGLLSSRCLARICSHRRSCLLRMFPIGQVFLKGVSRLFWSDLENHVGSAAVGSDTDADDGSPSDRLHHGGALFLFIFYLL